MDRDRDAPLIRLNDPRRIADWHRTLATLRTSDPVHWDDGIRAWIVTRYEDVKAGLYNGDLSARGPAAFMDELDERDLAPLRELRAFYDGWMVFSDTPYHEQVRACVQRVLTPRAVERRRARVREEAQRLAHAAAGRQVDVYSQFARPLAVNVICELLDIPAAVWDRFSGWSRDLIAFISTPRPEAELGRKALESYYATADYVRGAAKELKAAGLTGNPILAVEELGEAAMVATFAQFLTGGCDPISAAIGNAVATVLQHPAQLDRVRADEGLVATVIEECLRFETPFTIVPKVVARQTQVAGVSLPAGSRVHLMIAAANRDPEVFPDPNAFDAGRTPNPHLGFGLGAHYCIGAGLARVEMAETVRMLADPGLRWSLEGSPTWVSSFGLRSVATVPARIELS